MPQDTTSFADSYHPPVWQLLDLGEDEIDEEFDCAAHGLGLEHAADLIRMVTDNALHGADETSPVVFAPVYAWRALGQLKVKEAIAPLLTVLRYADRESADEWVSEELPAVLGGFGKPALEPLSAFLADVANGQYSRGAATMAFAKAGTIHPELRLECIERLSRQLGAFASQTEEMNGFVLWALMDLKAVEAMPVIRRAFEAGAVDETMAGDLEEVEIEFGLREPRPLCEPSSEDAFTERAWERFLAQEAIADMRAVGIPDEQIFGNSDLPDPTPYIADVKIGRNDPCPCNSGKKYKKCCGK